MKLDMAMREGYASHPGQAGGCTALCAILTPSHVFFANLGNLTGDITTVNTDELR